MAEGYASEAPTHGSWLVIDVTIASTTGTVNYNALDWEAATPQGQVESYVGGVLDNQLQHGEVQPGRIVRGELAFDVPTGPAYIDYSIGFEVLTTFEVTS
ncbi:DUF4352 domain-containing protein [Geodermatophilus sabuli]|uniref:DUF4352 domain-containing protein n=1 Tax=Geodermatophilus sabuli TaxID=1564158 RepID=A0A7K3W7W9_9ACTN|nr:DUF4352 domain-containing protein [Geodermatophilus sabuli]NEK60473.1 DUF4352 domain-containing protein [Geodermatophilus sabuli]